MAAPGEFERRGLEADEPCAFDGCICTPQTLPANKVLEGAYLLSRFLNFCFGIAFHKSYEVKTLNKDSQV